MMIIVFNSTNFINVTVHELGWGGSRFSEGGGGGRTNVRLHYLIVVVIVI